MDVHMAAAVYLAAVNIVTFAVFGRDKIKARWGGWRVPEKTLLLLAVLGGSVGAWIGMKVFRHKIRKGRFKAGILAILTLQCAGAVLLWKMR